MPRPCSPLDSNVLLERGSNEVRDAQTLELLGHWFTVTSTRYFVPLTKKHEDNRRDKAHK